MYQTMDIVGIGFQPRREFSPELGLYFVIFIIVAAWFNSNLFTGALLSTFKKLELEHKSGGLLMTDEQRQWVQLQRQMINTQPSTTYQVRRGKARREGER